MNLPNRYIGTVIAASNNPRRASTLLGKYKLARSLRLDRESMRNPLDYSLSSSVSKE
jgi:hypothetical protein